MKLTPAYFSSSIKDASEAKSAVFRGKNITHIEDLSPFTNLQRLDLAENGMKSGEALSGLRYCTSLTWISVAKNQLDDIHQICHIKGLQVLNASNNELELLPWDELTGLSKLKALILNNNRLKAIPVTASKLPVSLDTLVLSHNSLSEFPVGFFSCLKDLTKASISHNALHDVPDVSTCWALKELRLAGNRIHSLRNLTAKLPASLEILDLGHNLIADETSFEALLSSPLKRLVSINLKGNPLEQKLDATAILAKLRKAFPQLKVFNGKNLTETKPKKRPAYCEMRIKPERQNKNSKLTFQDNE
jgi:Leucine-rich repeat (LRR) protein